MESMSGPERDPRAEEPAAPAPPPEYQEPFAAGYGPPIQPPVATEPAPGAGPYAAPPPGGDPYAAPPHGPPAGYAPQAYGPPAPGSMQSAQNVAMFAHLSGLLFGFLGPLIVWLTKREEHPYIDDQRKEALNFGLSVMIYSFAAVFLTIFLSIVTLGLAFLLLFPVLMAFGIGVFVLIIIAATKASRGELYRYPLTIRMVR